MPVLLTLSILGRVERLAGKVFRDPEIEARGMRHMVRVFFFDTASTLTLGPRFQTGHL